MERSTTKERLSIALKDLLRKNAMEKITVSDITAKCGMGRQSFYYHFRDKYALLEWIIQNDLETYLSACPRPEDWHIYTLQLLRHILEDKRFYMRVVGSQNELFFHQYSSLLEYQILRIYLDDENKDENIEGRIRFAARFFSYGFAGAMVQWISDGMKTTPEQCIDHLYSIGMNAKNLRALYLRGAKEFTDTPQSSAPDRV